MRLTEAQFEALAELTRLMPHKTAYKAVRAHVVEGMTVLQACQKHDAQRSAVYYSLGNFRKVVQLVSAVLKTGVDGEQQKLEDEKLMLKALLQNMLNMQAQLDSMRQKVESRMRIVDEELQEGDEDGPGKVPDKVPD